MLKIPVPDPIMFQNLKKTKKGPFINKVWISFQYGLNYVGRIPAPSPLLNLAFR